MRRRRRRRGKTRGKTRRGRRRAVYFCSDITCT